MVGIVVEPMSNIPRLEPAARADIGDVRGPIVEPLDGDPDHCAVTFVWRGDNVDGVLVMLNTVVEAYRDDLSPALMTRIPDTDVWYLSLRLPSDLRASYQFLPLSSVDLSAASDPASWMRLRTLAVPDPANPHLLPSWLPGAAHSVLTLPDAPADFWSQPRHDVARGRLEQYTMDNQRAVWVYTPPGDQDEPYPVLVLLDGDIWGGLMPISSMLDNLISDGLIPPLIAVMPCSPDFQTRNRELAMFPPFLEFLTAELLTWAGERWPITDDPAWTIVAGQSLGGLTALAAAAMAPGRFGRVLSQSGAFQAVGALSLPVDSLTVHLQVGTNEWRLLAGNRDIRDRLMAHGHTVTYEEYQGGHDLACWRVALPVGLSQLSSDWVTFPATP